MADDRDGAAWLAAVSGDRPAAFPTREAFPIRDLDAAVAASADCGPQVPARGP